MSPAVCRLARIVVVLAPLVVVACAEEEPGAQTDNLTDADEVTLCEQTGGTFDDGVCNCVVDGASINYEFVLGVGCTLPLD